MLSVLAGGGALMAIAGSGAVDTGAAGSNANGGVIGQGAESDAAHRENLDGAASQTSNDKLDGQQTSVEDFDNRGLSRKILELQPMKTPFDQLTRHATTGEKPAGMKVEYASIGSRPTETTYTGSSAFTITGTAMSGTLTVADPQIFSVDDVILVPAVKAVTNAQGEAYSSLGLNNELIPSLMLKVCGYDDSNSMPVVYALNGDAYNGQNIQIKTNTIPTDAKLLRIAKAVNEGASQTGRTAELPKTDTQYLQIFMTQTEESLVHKLTQRDVDGLNLAWNERRTLEDMRMVQEGTFLFSDMACIKNHPKENLNKVWTTKGAWYQAGNVVDFGTPGTNTGDVEITDDDLVDVNRAIFTGEGTGGKKKLWFCGSNMIQALEKIKSDKFRLKGDVQAWNLTFTSWKTTFGEALVIHDETLDKYGKEDYAFSLDPEYFEKRVLLSLDRNAIDLNSAGIRATEAVVLKEISCVILYAPKAHSIIKLNRKA